ncbi:MAG: hypothetical protein ACLQRH_09700, partial [Acidimicrobiales bacterium]
MAKALGRAGLGLLPLVLVGAVLVAAAGGLSPHASAPAMTTSPKVNGTATTRSTGTADTTTTATSTTTTSTPLSIPTTSPTGSSNSAQRAATVLTSPPPSTPNVAPTTTTSTDPPLSAGVIGVSGGHLELNGQPYTFTGVNAYEIGTEVDVNPGCGGQESDAQLNELF